MDDNPRHLADFHLCQRCLEGNASSIAFLRDNFGSPTSGYLVSKGALPQEAVEVVESMWADLLVAESDRPPRLARFQGASTLQTWLNTVALNRLLTRKRADQRWQRLAPARVGGEEDGSSARLADPETSEPEDALLIELMRHAIECAFSSCAPEDFVLLHLKHYDGLRGAELAAMFGCDESVVSRRIDKAESQIATATLMEIRRTDPWIELKWPDFLDLCRTATPACFGAG
ncbi:MAG TPA: hypothetical protein VEO95_10940 [Chthoniobacteraceae bacterium]|nr:hypothetical protein [Chthoniobacteraceae bacterium]